MKKMNPVVHFEIPGKDRDRMIKFYEEAFGWKMEKLGKDMGNYVLVTTAEKNEKTGFPKEPGRINGGFYMSTNDPISQYPSVVVAVDDIKESRQKVVGAGGKLSGDVQEIPGWGLYASVFDSEGNRIGMMQPFMDQNAK